MPRDTMREVDACRIAVLLMALMAGVLFLIVASGCRIPDAAVMAADAEWYDSIGREYEANLEAGRIWPLRRSVLGGATLTAEPLDEDMLARRRRSLATWKALRDEIKAGR